MQTPVEGHETLVNPLPSGLVRFGTLWIVQPDPSHTSTPGPFNPGPNDPTLVHATAETHDTPSSVLKRLVLGPGTFSIVQLLPSQRSASGWVASGNESDPTAVHADAAAHEIPFR